MNGLDWAVLVALAAGTVLGYARGLVGQLVSFVGFFIAYVTAFLLYDDAAPYVQQLFALSGQETFSRYEYLAKELRVDGYVYNVLAFGILLLGVKLLFGIAGRLLNVLAAAPGIKQLNQWGGGLLGLVEALLLVIIVVHVLTVTPSDTAQRLLKQSVTAPYLLEHTPLLTDKLQELWEQRSERFRVSPQP